MNTPSAEPPEVEVEVRPREDADLPTCAALLLEVHRQDGYPVEGVDEPLAWLQPDSALRSWVATVGGQVAGQVTLVQEPGVALSQHWRGHGEGAGPAAEVVRLFVGPRWRKHGCGRRLMEAVMAYGRSQGLVLLLEVLNKDQGAIRLYEALGWNRFGELSHEAQGNTYTAQCYAWSADAAD